MGNLRRVMKLDSGHVSMMPDIGWYWAWIPLEMVLIWSFLMFFNVGKKLGWYSAIIFWGFETWSKKWGKVIYDFSRPLTPAQKCAQTADIIALQPDWYQNDRNNWGNNVLKFRINRLKITEVINEDSCLPIKCTSWSSFPPRYHMRVKTCHDRCKSCHDRCKTCHDRSDFNE